MRSRISLRNSRIADEPFAFFAIRIANVADRMTHEVGDLHAGNHNRILERQKHPQSSPFVGFHFGDIDAIDFDRCRS